MVTNTPLPVVGTVGATQSGTWNVGISGTPNVTVSSLPMVQFNGPQPVVTTNSENNPAFIRDVDSVGRFPFVTQLCKDTGQGFCGTVPSSIDVPRDVRLVIEEFSATCVSGDITQPIPGVELFTFMQAAGRFFPYFMPLTSFPNRSRTFGMQLTKIYADPGGGTVGSVDLFIAPVSENGGIPANSVCLGTLSGHLVRP